MVELRTPRGRRKTRALALSCALVATVAPRAADAQIHWDASAQVGGMKRFLVGASDAGVGVVGQLTGHIALAPLVHVGGYFGHDISPLADPAAPRNITFGGARARVMLPLGSQRFHAWGFAGFGFAGVYAQSYHREFSFVRGASTVREDALVQGAGGHFFETPFGIGASYRFWKPWEVCAELGARVGFAHSGSVYEGNGPQVSTPGSPDQNVGPSGTDRFALGLTVGILVDQ